MPSVASAIRTWAISSYEGFPVRVLEESQIHSTLLFYPSVSDEKREWMIEMVHKVEWEPMEATTGETERMGRGALALDLVLSDHDAKKLDDRLVRSCVYGPEYDYRDYRHEPLGKLALALSEAEWEPRRRNHRHRRQLRLHTTFARVKKHTDLSVPLYPFGPIPVRLSKLALYESNLGPGGSRYEIIAESS